MKRKQRDPLKEFLDSLEASPESKQAAAEVVRAKLIKQKEAWTQHSGVEESESDAPAKSPEQKG